MTDPEVALVLPAGSEVELLAEEVEAAPGATPSAVLSEATRAAYRSDLTVFRNWCELRGVEAVPESPDPLTAVTTILLEREGYDPAAYLEPLRAAWSETLDDLFADRMAQEWTDVNRTGAMTVILDVRDSRTGELLVRVADGRAIRPEDTGLVGGYENKPVNNWAGVWDVSTRWARLLRETLDALRELPSMAPPPPPAAPTASQAGPASELPDTPEPHPAAERGG